MEDGVIFLMSILIFFILFLLKLLILRLELCFCNIEGLCYLFLKILFVGFDCFFFLLLYFLFGSRCNVFFYELKWYLMCLYLECCVRSKEGFDLLLMVIVILFL